jgi:hypothetical protein
MPGMCEAHTHFSWNDAGHAGRHPDHAARGARAVVRQGRQALPRGRLHRRASARPAPSRGWTSSSRNAINAGQIPGPRYLAASQEITVPGGLGDETLPHLPFPEFSFGVNVNGARTCARSCACS